MRSCTGNVVMSSLKKRMRPAVVTKSPVMALNSVVLPAPFEPMMARRSLAATRKVMPDSATRAPKCRATLSSSRACAPDSCRRAATDTSDTLVSQIGLLRAARIVAAGLAEREKLGFRNAQRLVDLRNDLDELVIERSVGVLGHFRQELVGDGVAVLVQRDLAGRRLQDEAGERRAPLAPNAGLGGVD